MLYRIGIMKQNITRKQVPSDEVCFHVCKRANSRIEALQKALPQIVKEVLPQTDPSIKYVSIFIGQVGRVSGSASRLTPIQIVRETGKIR